MDLWINLFVVDGTEMLRCDPTFCSDSSVAFTVQKLPSLPTRPPQSVGTIELGLEVKTCTCAFHDGHCDQHGLRRPIPMSVSPAASTGGARNVSKNHRRLFDALRISQGGVQFSDTDMTPATKWPLNPILFNCKRPLEFEVIQGRIAVHHDTGVFFCDMFGCAPAAVCNFVIDFSPSTTSFKYAISPSGTLVTSHDKQLVMSNSRSPLEESVSTTASFTASKKGTPLPFSCVSIIQSGPDSKGSPPKDIIVCGTPCGRLVAYQGTSADFKSKKQRVGIMNQAKWQSEIGENCGVQTLFRASPGYVLALCTFQAGASAPERSVLVSARVDFSTCPGISALSYKVIGVDSRFVWINTALVGIIDSGKELTVWNTNTLESKVAVCDPDESCLGICATSCKPSSILGLGGGLTSAGYVAVTARGPRGTRIHVLKLESALDSMDCVVDRAPQAGSMDCVVDRVHTVEICWPYDESPVTGLVKNEDGSITLLHSFVSEGAMLIGQTPVSESTNMFV